MVLNGVSGLGIPVLAFMLGDDTEASIEVGVSGAVGKLCCSICAEVNSSFDFYFLLFEF